MSIQNNIYRMRLMQTTQRLLLSFALIYEFLQMYILRFARIS